MYFTTKNQRDSFNCCYILFREGKYAANRREALAFKQELEQIKKKVRLNVVVLSVHI